jgi:hypothetical protein
MDATVGHVLWFFGLLVGLAIEQALVRSVPHLIFAPRDTAGQTASETFRLIVFLTIVCRFFWGAVLFFNESYLSANRQGDTPRRHFAWDFLTGFLHFLIIFFWAFTIPVHTRDGVVAPAQWLFLAVLSTILLYDLPWKVLTWRWPSERINLWCVLNAFTVITAGFAYLMIAHPAVNGNAVTAEAAALVIVMIASVLDLVELATGGKFFARQLLRFVPESVRRQLT